MTMAVVDFDEFQGIDEWLEWWLSEPRLDDSNQAILNKYYSGYRQRFSSYIRHHYKNQTRDVSSLMQPGMQILEVGCVCGTESLWFAFKGSHVTGIDLASDRLRVARSRKIIAETHFNKR